MPRNRSGSGANEVYGHFLRGYYANNPANNRLQILERMYQRILTELAANRFKWTGFPDSVNTRYLELTLFRFGLSVFFYDRDYMKFLALAGSINNQLNYQQEPVAFLVTGAGNYKTKTISAKEAVPIWANYLRMPDLDIVHIYSTKLAEIDRTIEINSKNARRNKVIVSSENQRLSHENVARQLDEGQSTLRVGGAIQDMAFMQALDLGIDPLSILNLHILRTRIWNECMGLLGIENANQDKKERLVAAEVDANQDQTSMMRYVNLNERQNAAGLIKTMFGLEIAVEYYTDEEREQMGISGLPAVTANPDLEVEA
jgi:hypothetical protein